MDNSPVQKNLSSHITGKQKKGKALNDETAGFSLP